MIPTVSLTPCHVDQRFPQITAPADLTVLMSAVPQGTPEPVDGGKKRLHRFLQKIPIQGGSSIGISYLGDFSTI